MSNQRTLYTTEQVQKIEKYAINQLSVSSFALMQSAAQRCFIEIQARYPSVKKIKVFCGVGNNAGDGYLVAKLAQRLDYKVAVIQLGNAEKIKGDALKARDEFIYEGGVVSRFQSNEIISTNTDLIVDAIFGIGLSREVKGEYQEAIDAINNYKVRFPKTNILAVDIPSGLVADTGAIFGSCVQSDLCVSFVGLKRGLFTGQACDHIGEIVFDDLNIPDEAYQQLNLPNTTELVPNGIVQAKLKKRKKSSHKGDFGHVLLVGGAEGMNGAIRLAAEATLRCGAGLVSVATHSSHANTLNIGRPEIMVQGIAQVNAIKPMLEKANVIVIGPGLGMSDWSNSLFNLVIKSELPMVIDADALNLLANSAINTYPNNWILTPHPKEMSRILNCTTAEIESNRYGSVEKCSKSEGVSILKGAGTLICDGKQTMVSTKGNPGMASGGMGDVLSGVIAALLAQGLSPFDAACTGVHLHACAADKAAIGGERGLLASDLLPHLRTLVNNTAVF